MTLTVKQGKHLAFRNVGQKKFTRLRVLGDEYSKERIIVRLSKKKDFNYNNELNFMIDIDKIIKRGKGPAYYVCQKNLILKNLLRR